ncbi:rhodanese-like domain-containing protein [Enterococcus sp. 669A]|uniref:Rhodanese-like domain-containing protein n=1 Tax=Candidatus Enterococcus moelleringii TaxID=2815325 RepID=A0ABS3LEB1_9ENTE|nr:rhodanese-like domain-containing protein [Enterococcus sp. 669A]MBO1307960.1 rhodanese-like domain-containing protein [Enterococcus sp. 669A]
MNYSMTTQEFVALAKTQSLNVLDLRDPDFFEIENMKSQSTITSMPLTELPSRYTELDKNQTYYLFSQSGKRAKTMAYFLNEKGYQAVNVIGGTAAVLNYLELFHSEQLSLVKHPATDVFSQSMIIIKMLGRKQKQATNVLEFV